MLDGYIVKTPRPVSHRMINVLLDKWEMSDLLRLSVLSIKLYEVRGQKLGAEYWLDIWTDPEKYRVRKEYRIKHCSDGGTENLPLFDPNYTREAA